MQLCRTCDNKRVCATTNFNTSQEFLRRGCAYHVGSLYHPHCRWSFITCNEPRPQPLAPRSMPFCDGEQNAVSGCIKRAVGVDTPLDSERGQQSIIVLLSDMTHSYSLLAIDNGFQSSFCYCSAIPSAYFPVGPHLQLYAWPTATPAPTAPAQGRPPQQWSGHDQHRAHTNNSSRRVESLGGTS